MLRRALRAGLPAVAALLLAPAGASALTIDVSSGTLRLTGAGAEANKITVERSGASLLVTESGTAIPLTLGTGCVTGGSGRATCTAGAITVALGDGNDTATVLADVPATLDGGAGNDTLAGGPQADVLRGGSGTDVLSGGAGDDRLDGGDGADVQSGGDGNDLADYGARRSAVYVDLDGNADDGQSGEGDDVRADVEQVLGGTSDDRLVGTAGPQVLTGGAGNDTLEGQSGSDQLLGGDGNDTMRGNEDADNLDAGAGNDSVDGGSGPDVLLAGDGADKLYGNEDDDTLDAGTGDDSSWGGPGSDTLRGGDGRDKLYGEDGDDALEGQAGDDTLDGNAGNDALDGGDGADRIGGEDGDDRLSGAAGNDELYAHAGNDALDGGDGDDRLDGAEGDDTLLGSAGNDKLYAQAGNDVLDGGDGNDGAWGSGDDDTIRGGAGADELDGQDGADVVDGGDDADIVRGGNGPDDVAGGAGDDDVQGGEQPDQLRGGDGADDLSGGGDADRLSGDAGDDDLGGGGGDDVLAGGDGADTLRGDDGQDTVDYGDRLVAVQVTNDGKADDGAAGERDQVESSIDDAIGGAGDDTLTLTSDWPHSIDGGAGNDRLQGGGKEDDLVGGPGKDMLIGAGGVDRFDGGDGPDHLSAADGAAEQLLCGAGDDVAVLDAIDKPSKCETRKKGTPTQSGVPENTVPATTEHAATISGVRRLTGGGRFVAIPGFPGERIDRRLLPDIKFLVAKYKVRVTDGYALHGHDANGEHPRGLAVDLVPGAGGSWDTVDALARWAEPRQNRPRPPFRWVGYNGDPNHGRGNHLHLSWMHSATGRGRPAKVIYRLAFKGGTPVVGTTQLANLASRSNPQLGGVPSVRTGLADQPRCRGAEPLKPTWQAAGRAFGIRWQVLAGITSIESRFGCLMGPSSAGAIGWTQFMPATWKLWGTDADGDGKASPYNSVDAIYSTARYLRASGAPGSYTKALFAYNHADWYVKDVLKRAKAFG